MTDENRDETPTATPSTDPNETAQEDTPPQYGVGPFSVREVALIGVLALAFILSFVPFNAIDEEPAAALVGGANVWVSGLSWILAIGLPILAVGLIVLRRLSPEGIRRVGSLGIDQFASVSFSVAALVWLQWVWQSVAVVVDVGVWTHTWVVWVEAALMLAGVVLTVLAPIVPVLEQDFEYRREVSAHPNARPARPVVARPKPEPRPEESDPSGAHPGTFDSAAPQPAPYVTGTHPMGAQNTGAHATGAHATGAQDTAAQDTGAQDTDAQDTDVFAPLREEFQPSDGHAQSDEQQSTSVGEAFSTEQYPQAQPTGVQQAFWALVPEERDVVDEYGRPLFRIGPTAWALVIEDRGPTFVVRHEDGRVGYLHDTTGVTRG